MIHFPDLPQQEATSDSVAAVLSAGLRSPRTQIVLMSGGRSGRPVAVLVSATRARALADQRNHPGVWLIEADRVREFRADLIHVVLRVGRPVCVMGTLQENRHPAAPVPARWVAEAPTTTDTDNPERN